MLEWEDDGSVNCFGQSICHFWRAPCLAKRRKEVELPDTTPFLERGVEANGEKAQVNSVEPQIGPEEREGILRRLPIKRRKR